MTDPYYQDDLVTLYCGDCLDNPDWWTGADVLVTDPPYGLEAQAGGYGRMNKVIASDMTTEARDRVFHLWGARPLAAFGSPRMPEPPGGWSDRLVWDKREPGLNGGPWRYTHELIFVRGSGWRRVGPASFSVISCPSGNGTWMKRQHVHAKPVALMQQLIAASPAGVIADPFAGSGSTLVAAKALGRRSVGVEVEERYCELAANRLAQDVLDFGGTA